jgi:hypothetical protein
MSKTKLNKLVCNELVKDTGLAMKKRPKKVFVYTQCTFRKEKKLGIFQCFGSRRLKPHKNRKKRRNFRVSAAFEG